jgi:tetratricopeptide (TPR) repeat protein
MPILGVLIGVLLGLATERPARAPSVDGQHPAPPAKRAPAPASKPAATPSGTTLAEFEALRAKAESARAGDRHEEAAAAYERALALQPTWAEGRWMLATIYYDLDRHRECRDAFAAVVRQEPEHGAAWAFQGLCAFALKDYGEALDALNRGWKLGIGESPDFAAIVGYHRAILMTRFGQFERAFDTYAGFVRGGGITPEIVEGLGIAALRMPLVPSEVPPGSRELVDLAGRAGIFIIGMAKAQAQAVFAELLRKYPDTPNVHYLYGTFLAREKPVEAMEEFKAELTRSPDHVLARLWIAQELIKQNDFDGARPYAEDAARLAPRDFLARKVLGQIKLQAGDAAGAIVELEAARELEPSSPSVRFQLARAYQRSGRADDARRERGEFSRLEAIQQKQRGGQTGPPKAP